MKLRSILFSALCALMTGTAFTACSNSNDNEPEIPPEPLERCAYILYEGAWGANNAGISKYFVNTKNYIIADYYYQANGEKPMGDLANAMIEEDNQIYVVVGGSKYVARLDKNCVEQVRRSFGEGEGEPRQLDVEDGYVYVTQQGGQVSKLDAQTLEVVATFKGGDNLEGIVEEDGKLYVANSFKGVNVYNKEVFIINAATMTLEKTLEVVENPTDLTKIDDTVYLLSAGNYADIAPALQAIDTKTGKVTPITDATKITEGNNGLIYGLRSTYDAEWNMTNAFFTYNPKTGTLSDTSFLKDAPESFKTTAIYLMEVDEQTGDIYVGISDYTTNGDIYRFDANGILKNSFDAGGINPCTMIFMD